MGEKRIGVAGSGLGADSLLCVPCADELKWSARTDKGADDPGRDKARLNDWILGLKLGRAGIKLLESCGV